MSNKKLVFFILLLCTAALISGGCSGGDGTATHAILDKIYYIGNVHGDLAAYLREIAAEFLPYDGEATDSPLLVSLREGFEPDESTAEAVKRVFDAGQIVALEHATVDEVNVFLTVIGQEPNFNMDTVSEDLRYVELYAVEKLSRDAVHSDLCTWITPADGVPTVLSEPIASDDDKPGVPDMEAFHAMRARNFATYAADNEAKQEAIRQAREAGEAAVTASTSELTQLAQAQIYTYDASIYSQAFQVTYYLYACHSYNEANNVDYDWFVVQQRGMLNPSGNYENKNGHIGWSETTLARIQGYMVNYEFDNWLDYDNSRRYVQLMNSTPGTTQGSSSTTSGFSWNLGGNIGFNASGPTGGLSAGISFSSSESVTISDCTVTNSSVPTSSATNAHWTFSFPRPTIKSSGGNPFYLGEFNDAVLLSRSNFQPYNQWMWKIAPEARDSVKQFNSKFSWKNGRSYGNQYVMWVEAIGTTHQDWESDSRTYVIPFIYPPLIAGNNLDFDAKGSHARLDFGTARNWTAASDQFWCTLSATSGDKNAASNVFVTVDPNASGVDRTAVITLSTADGKGTYKVKVFQSRY